MNNSLINWEVGCRHHSPVCQGRRTGWLWYKWRVINFSSAGREHMDAQAGGVCVCLGGSEWDSVHVWIRSRFERYVCRHPPLCQQSLSSCRHGSRARSSASACVAQILHKYTFHLLPDVLHMSTSGSLPAAVLLRYADAGHTGMLSTCTHTHTRGYTTGPLLSKRCNRN